MSAHALLSASGADRWLNCPPSARLTENLSENTSVYAEEGTLAHELAEMINAYNFAKPLGNDMTKAKFNKALKVLQEKPLYQPDMLDYIDKGFTRYVFDEYQAERTAGNNPIILFEQKLDYSAYVPEGFGTGDVLLISNKVLNIIDLKYGKGIQVDAENNKQMMLYALGAFEAFDMLYDFDTVRMTIHQPRLDHISVWELPITDLLRWANEELRGLAALAFDGAGDFKAGDHCKWCKVKATCRARAEENLKLQKYEYQHPNLLNNAEIGDILRIADRLQNWAKDVAAYALEKALEGENFKGFKLVEGRSNRTFTDDVEVENLLRTNNFVESDYINKKLKGIGDLEKLLTKPVFTTLLGDQVVKPQGKPTLAPETDKRPVFNSAAIDFANIDDADLPF